MERGLGLTLGVSWYEGDPAKGSFDSAFRRGLAAFLTHGETDRAEAPAECIRSLGFPSVHDPFERQESEV